MCYNKDTKEQEKEVTTMKAVRELMSEATTKGYDVAVQDGEGLWMYGYGGWSNQCEGWFNEEHYYDHEEVLRVEWWEEEKIMVLVIEEE